MKINHYCLNLKKNNFLKLLNQREPSHLILFLFEPFPLCDKLLRDASKPTPAKATSTPKQMSHARRMQVISTVCGFAEFCIQE